MAVDRDDGATQEVLLRGRGGHDARRAGEEVDADRHVGEPQPWGNRMDAAVRVADGGGDAHEPGQHLPIGSVRRAGDQCADHRMELTALERVEQVDMRRGSLPLEEL